MSADDNKKTVLAWIEAANSRNEAAISSMLTDDFKFIAMARAPEWIKYRWGKEEFIAAPRAMSTLMKRPIHLDVVGMIAEGDKVAVEAETDGELNNGKVYDNAYHFVFKFRDGKIYEVREYCCSYLVEHTFGEFNPNRPQANPNA